MGCIIVYIISSIFVFVNFINFLFIYNKFVDRGEVFYSGFKDIFIRCCLQCDLIQSVFVNGVFGFFRYLIIDVSVVKEMSYIWI